MRNKKSECVQEQPRSSKRAVSEAEPSLARRGVSEAATRLCAHVLRPHGYQTGKKAAKVSRVSGITFQSRARFYIDHTEIYEIYDRLRVTIRLPVGCKYRHVTFPDDTCSALKINLNKQDHA